MAMPQKLERYHDGGKVRADPSQWHLLCYVGAGHSAITYSVDVLVLAVAVSHTSDERSLRIRTPNIELKENENSAGDLKSYPI